MTSILPTIAAKSDQLNAEDLIGGPRTVTVTNVTVRTSDDQPVWVHFEGDDKKPFKPCKTMRRLLVRVWGDDSSVYAGRSMTLYHDPDVKYGGMAVGGIRISHMSNMDREQSFFLTETRGKKKQHTVKPIKAQSKMPAEPSAERLTEGLAALGNAQTESQLFEIWSTFRDLQAVPQFVTRKDEMKEALSQPADGF